jgi:hypothetical protein
MFFEYFTPVYLCKVCSVLTSILKNFVDRILTGVLYTVQLSTTVTFRKVDICLLHVEKGKRNPNLTGAFERCILCLYTDRDLILRKVPTEWATSLSHLPTLRRKQVLF